MVDVIWRRFKSLIDGEITASKVLALKTETMRSIRTLYNRAAYIKNIAQTVTDWSLTGKFTEMPNEVVLKLTAIKGIGE